MKSKFWNYLFWLVIAAAFIGPGTVTTAASAGANYRFQLLWALLFSTLACLVVQEAAARVTIVSGKSLGQAIKQRFSQSAFVWFIGISIFLGCLAYEAGNILGAISGLAVLKLGIPQWIFTTIIAVVSFLLLFFEKTKSVPQILGAFVAIMGVGLFYAALSFGLPWGEVLNGLVVPRLPDNSTLIVLGLIGTTIVPYNIFLGSGLAEGKELKSVRSGLIFSILLGGLVSMAVLLVGTSLDGRFNFDILYEELVSDHGPFMGYIFAFGLFGAGFTSTITAALAGALTIRSVHPKGETWSNQSRQFRSLWAVIIIIGFGIGISGIRPIPVIIAAQAANGFILPILTFALWVLTNSKRLGQHMNGIGLNLAMFITLLVTSVLGLINVSKAFHSAIGESFAFSGLNRSLIIALALVFTALALWTIQKERRVNI
ncbi:Nramp family divalent metal transporter [Roseivirga sp.]|uniref:Nramp family divalent metal transporter n=1 Tax=Roseivirga sp. TaxID=1964215 RepID=UPI003B518600